jgi:predicted porin
MNKKLLAAAVVAAVAASPAAFADSTIYGKLHTTVDYNDIDVPGPNANGPTSGSEAIKNWTAESRASRLGFKGSEDLGDGLKAIYQIEFGINSVGTSPPNNGFTSQRNTFVGLTGDWGTALVGRHDTPMKMAFYASGNEVLGDSIIDLNVNSSIIGVFQEVRASNAIAYVSPNFSGFTVAAAMVPGEETGIKSTSMGIVTNKNDLNNLADSYSFGLMYGGNGLKASAGYEVIGEGTGASNRADSKTFQVGATYTMNNFRFGAEYQDSKNWLTQDKWDYEAWAVTGKATFGNNGVGLVYTGSDSDPAGPSNDMSTQGWGVEGEHNFSKRTKVYAAYAWQKRDMPSGQADLDASIFSLGMIHDF